MNEFLNKTIEELTIFEAGIVIIIFLVAGAIVIGLFLRASQPAPYSMRLPLPKPGQVNPFIKPLMERAERMRKAKAEE